MSDSEKETLKDLVSKRSSIKGQVTKFKNYLEHFLKTKDFPAEKIAELQLKLNKLECLSVRFDDIQTKIEVLNSANIELELDERERIENDMVVNIAKAKTLIGSEERRQSVAHCDHQNIGFKLPQIQISKFNGSHFQWLEFRDTYTNLIHTNERMSDIHKFHYLLSYLEGDAARTISNLEVSNANYEKAWTILTERYDNKRILINHHLESLFNIQPLTRESEKSLRFLVDHVTKNLRALSSLGQPTTSWDLLIIFLSSSKLDSRTLLKWEEYRNTLDADVPTLEQFNKFLIDRADVLETINRSKLSSNNNSNKSPFIPRPNNANSSNVQPYANQNRYNNNNNTNRFQNVNAMVSANNQKPSGSYLCIICNGNHRIYDCSTFKAKSIQDKLSLVAKYKLCSNCLRQGHPVSECHMGPCRQCSEKHNTILHEPKNENNETVVAFSHQLKPTLLATVIIEVCNPLNNQTETIRAVLDNCSMSTLISKPLQQRLNLKIDPIETINIIGIGNNITEVNESCVVTLKSMQNDYSCTTACLILDDLTGDLPKAPIDLSNFKIPESIQLSDPNFNDPAPVELLIGADLFWDIIGTEKRYLGPKNPRLHNTEFGWIVGGPISQHKAKSNNQNIHCNRAIISTPNIEQNITKFWELEELPLKKLQSLNDAECEKHFRQNTTRLSSGRFCVKLPLKDSPDCLGDSYQQAKNVS
ncbi:hypothetical protein NE865_08293 [Phthorimaea operculella]|nr:hypothetical protein NE865_08293 [Phthorimaea operculella]